MNNIFAQVHQHPAVRPQSGEAAAERRRGRQRLHQRQLHPGLQLQAGVHRDPGAAPLHQGRLLAHVLGDQQQSHRHAHSVLNIFWNLHKYFVLEVHTS